MASNDIGIDLGTANVLISVSGKGIVLTEPSVVAIEKNTGSVLAVGSEAYKMIGKTPSNIVSIRPLQNGVISDYDTTEKMLNYFIGKVLNKKGMNKVFMPRVMVCVPTGVTGVEKIAVEEAVRHTGAKEVYTIEGPIAAAIGAGIDISSPNGSMVIDIGGGTADIAIISLGGTVISESIKIGGDKFDEAIIEYIKKQHNFLVGELTAEKIKIKIGTACMDEEKYMDISGINLVTRLPGKIQINSSEIKDAIEKCTQQIIVAACSVLEKAPPELSSDIYENGIIMTGGGSLLNGLDKRIQEKTNIKVSIAEDALLCVAKGTGASLSSLNLLEKNKK
ncbi:rod shape-determining protein [Paraclostridium bifermentans]|uniref:rod shape-determining protein n=1 Tax=Paraclostridium bifermentans TaxID=1490 RepID=UPI0034DE6D20